MNVPLVKCLCKFNNVNADLFEHDEEWELASMVFLLGFTDADISRLESIVSGVA